MNPNISYIITSLVVVVITFVLAFILNRSFKELIRRSKEDLQNDPTNYKFLRRIVVGLVYLVGFGIAVYVVPSLRIVASSILAGAGILAVAIGFASQHALSNVISGLFIVMFKPFRIGDFLTINTLRGTVEDITLRHVVLRDLENHRIIIPNSVISNESITNSHIVEGKVCKWIELGISYSSDVKKAKEIIRNEILKHPLRIDNRTQEQIDEGEPEVPVRLISLGDSSVVIRGWAWALNVADGFKMRCDLLESIKEEFEKNGIEIPFPQRDIHIKTMSNRELALTQSDKS